LDYATAARAAVDALSATERQELLAEWKRYPRLLDASTDDEVLARYATVVLDEIVERARIAAARTMNW
jgi:hypothetical protein